MIKQETLKNGLIRTYSDQNKYIIQVETGIEYAEAIDIPNKFTYTESDNDIPERKIDNIDQLLNNKK